jgi:hypothetical protein
MGYYTSYTLSVDTKECSPGVHESDVIHHFRSINEEAKYTLDAFGEPEDTCKWYDHEKDLKDFSRFYPDAVFELKGEGEESGDMWKLYVKNGKSQRCNAIITFEKFDESKLI